MSSTEIGIISLRSLMSKHKCSGTELPQITKLVMDGSSNTTSEVRGRTTKLRVLTLLYNQNRIAEPEGKEILPHFLLNRYKKW